MSCTVTTRLVLVRTLMLCLLLTGAAPPVLFTEEPAPLRDLPEGWLHLPEECIDCWTGAYHDSATGVYVHYSTSSLEEDRQYESFGLRDGEGSTTTGQLADLRYRILRVPDGRSYMSRRLELATSTSIAELDPQVTRILPPTNTPYLVFTILREASAWRFETAISNREQEDRVRDLLLNENRLEPEHFGSVYERARAIEADEYRRLYQGAAASEIIRRFGRPRTTSKRDAEGFVLFYDVRTSDEPSLCEVSIIFAKDQRLSAREADPTCRTLANRF